MLVRHQRLQGHPFTDDCPVVASDFLQHVDVAVMHLLAVRWLLLYALKITHTREHDFPDAPAYVTTWRAVPAFVLGSEPQDRFNTKVRVKIHYDNCRTGQYPLRQLS